MQKRIDMIMWKLHYVGGLYKLLCYLGATVALTLSDKGFWGRASIRMLMHIQLAASDDSTEAWGNVKTTVPFRAIVPIWRLLNIFIGCPERGRNLLYRTPKKRP